jgi:hypothetical protein
LRDAVKLNFLGVFMFINTRNLGTEDKPNLKIAILEFIQSFILFNKYIFQMFKPNWVRKISGRNNIYPLFCTCPAISVEAGGSGCAAARRTAGSTIATVAFLSFSSATHWRRFFAVSEPHFARCSGLRVFFLATTVSGRQTSRTIKYLATARAMNPPCAGA